MWRVTKLKYGEADEPAMNDEDESFCSGSDQLPELIIPNVEDSTVPRIIVIPPKPTDKRTEEEKDRDSYFDLHADGYGNHREAFHGGANWQKNQPNELARGYRLLWLDEKYGPLDEDSKVKPKMRYVGRGCWEEPITGWSVQKITNGGWIFRYGEDESREYSSSNLWRALGKIKEELRARRQASEDLTEYLFGDESSHD